MVDNVHTIEVLVIYSDLYVFTPISNYTDSSTILSRTGKIVSFLLGKKLNT